MVLQHVYLDAYFAPTHGTHQTILNVSRTAAKRVINAWSTSLRYQKRIGRSTKVQLFTTLAA